MPSTAGFNPVMGEIATRADIDSLMDWWKLAGVDTAIDEEPVAWLAKKEGTPRPAAKTATVDVPNATAPIAAVDLPTTLAAFVSWLAADTTALAENKTANQLAASFTPKFKQAIGTLDNLTDITGQFHPFKG